MPFFFRSAVTLLRTGLTGQTAQRPWLGEPVPQDRFLDHEHELTPGPCEHSLPDSPFGDSIGHVVSMDPLPVAGILQQGSSAEYNFRPGTERELLNR
jgi:hypothetical protein